MNKVKIGESSGLEPADEFVISIARSYYFNKEFTWDYDDICWEDVLAKAFFHGMSSLLYLAVKDNSKPIVPEWVIEQLRNAFLADFYKQALYQAEVGKLLKYLEDKGIEVIVLKGFVLSRTLYPDPVLRTFNDVDLLIKEKDWRVILNYVLEAGFKPTQGLTEILTPLLPGENFDHNFIFHHASGLKIELKYDPLELGVRSRLIEEIWERSIVNEFNDLKFRSLAPEHQLLHLLVHINHHGFRCIKWFIDIALILTSDKALDWELVARDAKRDGILTPVYFSLIQVCKLFDIKLDDEKMDKLRSGLIKSMIWRSTWPKKDIDALKGVQYGSLFFDKKLFSKWFIPNILLTGRANEKISYFLSRVFPPREFLEFKYSNGQKRSYAYYMAKRYGSLFKSSNRTKTRV